MDFIGNNKLNIRSEYKKIGSVYQRVSGRCRCNACHAKFVGGGGGVRDSFKINHKTFLHMRMNIGYLEPLVITSSCEPNMAKYISLIDLS